MWQSKELEDRTAILEKLEEDLTAEQVRLLALDAGAGTRSSKRKLQSTRLMLDLVTTWKADPMDGQD